MKKFLTTMVGVLIFLPLFLSSCTGVQIGYIGSNSESYMSGTYRYFDGEKTRVINALAGDVIRINYTSEVKSGDLSMKVLDHFQNTVLQLESNSTGIREISVDQDTNYTVVILGKNTEGSFKVEWKVN
jgi:hypothetical protein